MDVKILIIRCIQGFKYSAARSLSLVSELIICSACFRRSIYNHSGAVPLRVPRCTALVASAILVKFILSALYPQVLSIINLILTEARGPMLSSPEADVCDDNGNVVTLSWV